MSKISPTALTDALALANNWQKGDTVLVPAFRQLVLIEGGIEVYSEVGVIRIPIEGIEVDEPVAIERTALSAWHGTKRGEGELTFSLEDGVAEFSAGRRNRIRIPAGPIVGVAPASWTIVEQVFIDDAVAANLTDDIRAVGGFSGDPTVSGDHAGVHIYPGEHAAIYATDNLGAASCTSMPLGGRAFVLPHILATRSAFLNVSIPITSIEFGDGGQVTLYRQDGASVSFQTAEAYSQEWWASVLPGYEEGALLPDGLLQSVSSLKRLSGADPNSTGLVRIQVNECEISLSLPGCNLADLEATFDCAMPDVDARLPLATFSRAMVNTTHFLITDTGLVARRGRVTTYAAAQ
jgi:hypothetical protein